MSPQFHSLMAIVLIGLVLIIPSLLLIRLFIKQLGLSKSHAAWLFVVAVLGGFAAGVAQWINLTAFHSMMGYRSALPNFDPMTNVLVSALARGYFVLFGLPFAVKLYRAWMGLGASDAEKQPGAAGVRAWLSPLNLVFAAVIAIGATYGFDLPFLATFILLVAALLAYPTINSTIQTPMPAQQSAASIPPAEDLSPEREKVLALLEAGKITAEESAELLGALTIKSPAMPASAAAMPPTRRLAIIGAILVTVGFFLPWFSINLGRELSKMTGSMQDMAGQMMSSLPIPAQGGNGAGGFPLHMDFKTPTIQIAGGDIPNGLGWFVLLLGIGVAVLPFVAAGVPPAQQRLFSILALAVGALLLAYLVSGNFRNLSIGILFVAAGYALEIVAILKQNAPARSFPTSPVPRPV